MLKYLEGLGGHQRDISKQKAQKMIEQYGEEGQNCMSLSESRLRPPLAKGKGEKGGCIPSKASPAIYDTLLPIVQCHCRGEVD